MKEYIQLVGNDMPNAPFGAILWSEELRVAFNAAEGMQRFCGEIKTRTNKISTYFFTRCHVSTMMGLPGILFTVNDCGVDKLECISPELEEGDQENREEKELLVGQRKCAVGSTNAMASLEDEQEGESGRKKSLKMNSSLLQQFWNVIKPTFFYFRDMTLKIHPASSFYFSSSFQNKKTGWKNGRLRVIPISTGVSTVVSYLCSTVEELCFVPELAKQLGVLPGPKYGFLKKGIPVESDAEAGKMVQPSQVLRSSVGARQPCVLILDVDDLTGLQKVSENIQQLMSASSAYHQERKQRREKASSMKNQEAKKNESVAEEEEEEEDEFLPFAFPHTVFHFTNDSTLLQSESYIQLLERFFPETRYHVAKLHGGRVTCTLQHLYCQQSEKEEDEQEERKSAVPESKVREGRMIHQHQARRALLGPLQVTAFPTALLHRYHLHCVAPQHFPIMHQREIENKEDDNGVGLCRGAKELFWPFSQCFFVNPQLYSPNEVVEKNQKNNSKTTSLPSLPAQEEECPVATIVKKGSSSSCVLDSEFFFWLGCDLSTIHVSPAIETKRDKNVIVVFQNSASGGVSQLPTLETASKMLSERFFQKWSAFKDDQEHNDNRIQKETAEMAPVKKVSQTSLEIDHAQENHNNQTIVFFGTGSAIPSKYRNVSSFLYLPSKLKSLQEQKREETNVFHNAKNRDDDQGMEPLVLFDCGEGTLGQMNNYFSVFDVKGENKKESGCNCTLDECLLQIGLLFISHLHADHHLGFFSILHRRNQLILQEEHQKEQAAEQKKNIKKKDEAGDDVQRHVPVDRDDRKRLSHQNQESIRFSYGGTEEESERVQSAEEERVIIEEMISHAHPHMLPKDSVEGQEEEHNIGFSKSADPPQQEERKEPVGENFGAKQMMSLLHSSVLDEGGEYPRNVFSSQKLPPLLVIAPEEFVEFVHQLAPLLGVRVDSRFVVFEVLRPSLLFPNRLSEGKIPFRSDQSTCVALSCSPMLSNSIGVKESPILNLSWAQQFSNCYHWKLLAFPVDHPACAHALKITRYFKKKKCQQEMGIQSEEEKEVPVTSVHANVFENDDSFTLLYSGDTRPCPSVLHQAEGVDVLIHEATFDEALRKEAVFKKHSTAVEALEVATQCHAKHAILTHFSQRYPKGLGNLVSFLQPKTQEEEEEGKKEKSCLGKKDNQEEDGNSKATQVRPQSQLSSGGQIKRGKFVPNITEPKINAKDFQNAEAKPPPPFCAAFDFLTLNLQPQALQEVSHRFMPGFQLLLDEYESWSHGTANKCLRLGGLVEDEEDEEPRDETAKSEAKEMKQKSGKNKKEKKKNEQQKEEKSGVQDHGEATDQPSREGKLEKDCKNRKRKRADMGS